MGLTVSFAGLGGASAPAGAEATTPMHQTSLEARGRRQTSGIALLWRLTSMLRPARRPPQIDEECLPGSCRCRFCLHHVRRRMPRRVPLRGTHMRARRRRGGRWWSGGDGPPPEVVAIWQH